MGNGLEIDLSELPGDVAREFCECRHNRDVLALLMATQEQTAVAVANQGDHRAIEGLGAPVLNVAPTAFHYWGLREGYGCWRDRGFVREFARDNPAARVKVLPGQGTGRHGGARLQVGYERPVAAAMTNDKSTNDKGNPKHKDLAADFADGADGKFEQKVSPGRTGKETKRESKSYGAGVGRKAVGR